MHHDCGLGTIYPTMLPKRTFMTSSKKDGVFTNPKPRHQNLHMSPSKFSEKFINLFGANGNEKAMSLIVTICMHKIRSRIGKMHHLLYSMHILILMMIPLKNSDDNIA